jgi:hypothetical protein
MPPRRRRDRYAKEYQNYMGEVKTYLNKVERGRSVRKIDPSDEAFSPEAEALRQVQKQDKANTRFDGRFKRMADVKEDFND